MKRSIACFLLVLVYSGFTSARARFRRQAAAVIDPCKDVAVLPFQANGGLTWGSPFSINVYGNVWNPPHATPLGFNGGTSFGLNTGGGFNLGGWPHVVDLSHLCTKERKRYNLQMERAKASGRQNQNQRQNQRPVFSPDWPFGRLRRRNQPRNPWFLPDNEKLLRGRNGNNNRRRVQRRRKQ